MAKIEGYVVVDVDVEEDFSYFVSFILSIGKMNKKEKKKKTYTIKKKQKN